MRLLLHELELWTPASELLGGLYAPPPSPAPPDGQMSLTQRIQSPNTLPVVVAGTIALGTVILIGFILLVIKASCRRAGDQYMAEAALRELNSRTAGTGGGRIARLSPSRPSGNKNKSPPRVPVVIVEPDASVEVGYSLENEEHKNSESCDDNPPATTVASAGRNRSSEIPLWRAPTVNRLSIELAASIK